MQEMYTEHWCDIFHWGQPCSFDHYPTEYDDNLLNGGALRTAGRSPAVDFWRNRDNGNYRRVSRRTGTPEDEDFGEIFFY
eukprot:6373799-Karenia_brevis.AAC.1